MAKALYPQGKTVRSWLFPAAIFLGVLLYAVVKYGGPVWVDHAFMRGQVGLLNRLLSVPDPRPLEFYLGVAQQEIFGPISQCIAAMVFMLFSVRYLKGAGLFRFIIWTALFLLLTKPEVLGFPPYGDAIGGPFAEAIWLKSNHFNYAGLLQQPDYAAGGPRVYVFSIYPGYLALWMTLVKNPAVYFPLMHLVVFAMTATVAGLLREMLRKEFSEDIAALASAVFLFAPLVQAQTEALNMEPPCLFFIMLCAFFLSQKKIGPAAVFAILAAAQKGLGIMACWAVGFSVLLLWIHDPLRKRNGLKYLMAMGLMAVVPVAFLSAKYFLHDAHVSAGMVGLWKGWPSLYNSFIFNVFWASLVIYGIGELVRRRSFEEWFLPSGVMFVFGSMYFLLMLNFIAVSDRYRLSAYPFLVYGGFYAAALVVRSDVLRKLGLIVLALVYAFSSYGFFYGNSVDHIVSERSLEYRNDLLVDRALVKTVEEKYSTLKIGAPIILAHVLALPELGYVHKKLDVLIYGFPCTYGGIEEFSGLPNLDIKRTVFVSRYKNHPSGSSLVPFPVDEKDIILGTVHWGERTAWIFMGGFAIEKMFRIVSYLHKYHPEQFR